MNLTGRIFLGRYAFTVSQPGEGLRPLRDPAAEDNAEEVLWCRSNGHRCSAVVGTTAGVRAGPGGPDGVTAAGQLPGSGPGVMPHPRPSDGAWVGPVDRGGAVRDEGAISRVVMVCCCDDGAGIRAG